MDRSQVLVSLKLTVILDDHLLTGYRTYMLDGLYQSLIVFFMPYLLFAPATFNDPGGYNVNDNRQIGVYIANAAIIVINSYILLNTYRWDWLTVLITVISILLIFAWTGIYTAFTGSFQFYKAGAEVFGTLTFWSLTLLTVIVCLLPRFTAKAFQKMFMPRLVDIVRDEVRMGKYDYLDKQDVEEMLNPPPKQAMSDSSMNSSLQNGKSPESAKPDVDRPMSAIDRPMSATDRPMSAIDRPMSAIDRPLSGDPFRSTQNSDEHEYAGDQRGAQNRISNPFTLPRSSEERPRPSYDRLRQSTGEYGKMRPSFEESRDFTSANHLMRIVSSRGGMSREEQQVEYDRQR
jgi:phospholipid-translocating ATPase